jgi:hypothetical protein
LPTGLPAGSAKRLQNAIEATSIISQKPGLLQTPKALSSEIKAIAQSMKLSQRTVKRWVLNWLQAGRNPAIVVREFIQTSTDSDEPKNKSKASSAAYAGQSRRLPPAPPHTKFATNVKKPTRRM